MKIGEYTNLYSNPQAIKDLMEKRKQGVQFEAGDDAPHERSKWVEATRQMLGKDQNGGEYTFGRINGLTKTWSVVQIRDRYYLCKKMSSPAKYWWGMRKQEKENAIKKSV